MERAAEGFGFSRSINALIERLNRQGYDQAIEIATALKDQDSSFRLQEDELNIFGYHLLAKGYKDKALGIFRLNVSLFPKSANTYDSLAEIYEAMGNKNLAIKNYRLSLELDPANSNATEHLKKLTD